MARFVFLFLLQFTLSDLGFHSVALAQTTDSNPPNFSDWKPLANESGVYGVDIDISDNGKLRTKLVLTYQPTAAGGKKYTVRNGSSVSQYNSYGELRSYILGLTGGAEILKQTLEREQQHAATETAASAAPAEAAAVSAKISVRAGVQKWQQAVATWPIKGKFNGAVSSTLDLGIVEPASEDEPAKKASITYYSVPQGKEKNFLLKIDGKDNWFRTYAEAQEFYVNSLAARFPRALTNPANNQFPPTEAGKAGDRARATIQYAVEEDKRNELGYNNPLATEQERAEFAKAGSSADRLKVRAEELLNRSKDTIKELTNCEWVGTPQMFFLSTCENSIACSGSIRCQTKLASGATPEIEVTAGCTAPATTQCPEAAACIGQEGTIIPGDRFMDFEGGAAAGVRSSSGKSYEDAKKGVAQ